MKKWYNKLVWYIPGLFVGGVSGYVYWKYFGCDGACLITSGPVRSMLYFALMGALLNQAFKPPGKEATGTNK